MQGFIKHILRPAAVLLATLVLTSCIYEDEPDSPAAVDEPTMLSIGFQLPAMAARSRAGGGYEPGVDYENYVNVERDGYRIYFYDSSDRYITRFVPMTVSELGGSDAMTYSAWGMMPAELTELSDFKIVVLANWPAYPDDSALQPGVSTIGDLCDDASARFDCLTNFELNPDEGRVIPFYGVHHYTGVKIKKGKLNELPEPISLLRAMAKIEVISEIDGVRLTNVCLRGFNTTGYCAPAGVFSHVDYDHNGDWDADYVKTPHLPGDANDAGQDTAVLTMLPVSDSSGRPRWIAYVPEYRNINADDYKSHIEFNLDYQDEGDTPYDLQFAEYADGKIVAGSHFDILRNNYYRFTVSIAHGGLMIKVRKWDAAYDNNFTFE